jgi:hypothetical protein
VWQALHSEIEARGAAVVTVALDVRPEDTYRYIDAAAPTHPSLIDTMQVTNAAFGFSNVPMAVWIDENGQIVRPAESASVASSPTRLMQIDPALPERVQRLIAEARSIPDDSEAYRAAIMDWVERGADSRFALSADEVVARSAVRDDDAARASACFELGEYLRRAVGHDAAVGWWREAHRLQPSNWAYKRQAWTLVTTPDGAAENDLMQGPNEVYEGNWLDDVIAGGGGVNYTTRPQLT